MSDAFFPLPDSILPSERLEFFAHKPNVIVIAGGHSVASYDVRDLTSRGIVICVNDSILNAKCDIGLTMDRLWFEHRYMHTQLISLPMYIRKGINKINQRLGPRTVEFDCTDQSSEMSIYPNRLNGYNSGMCALNLALQFGACNVFLFGFDMCQGPNGEPYWYPPYDWVGGCGHKPKRLSNWVKEYASIPDQLDRFASYPSVRVYNVTHRSKLETFPKISFGEFLERTK